MFWREVVRAFLLVLSEMLETSSEHIRARSLRWVLPGIELTVAEQPAPTHDPSASRLCRFFATTACRARRNRRLLGDVVHAERERLHGEVWPGADAAHPCRR